MVFWEERDTRYIDRCCHLNEEGYEDLGRIIASRIRDDLTILGEDERPVWLESHAISR